MGLLGEATKRTPAPSSDGSAEAGEVEAVAGGAGHLDMGDAGDAAEEAVHAEGGGRGGRGGGEGEAKHDIEQVVGAGPGDDLLGADAKVLGDIRAEAGLVGVGVDVEGGGGGGLAHGLGSAVEVLVGIELDELVNGHADLRGKHLERLHGRVVREIVDVVAEVAARIHGTAR